MRPAEDLSCWHGLCHRYLESFISHLRSTAMKFETLMLESLLAVCMLLCALTMGAMLG